MNIRHRLQQLDKENIQKICSQMGIKSSGNGNKSQLITRLLLPLQTYKMKTKNPKKSEKITVVKPQSDYDEEEMKRLVYKLHNLNIKPYVPIKKQQERILKLMKKE